MKSYRIGQYDHHKAKLNTSGHWSSGEEAIPNEGKEKASDPFPFLHLLKN